MRWNVEILRAKPHEFFDHTHSSQSSQPPRLDPPRLNRLSSDEQLEGYRESDNDLNAVVDRLMQRTVENVPHAAPVDLAAPQTAASTIAK
jgi:hypothetical protein